MTTDEAFRAGLQKAVALGLPLRANDIPVIAARGLFDRQTPPHVLADPRFPSQGPEQAMLLIMQCAARAAGDGWMPAAKGE